ncbi:MAG: outer membrane protein assembly factor BamD [Candidatus Omnitrophota bacterium]
MKYRFVFFCVGLLMLGGCATLESRDRYRESLLDIDEGRIDFAVLSLKTLLKDSPDSPYASTAAFALGEYYFDHSDYFNSLNILSNYILRYPKHKGLVFAKLIIYKIISSFRDEKDLGQEEAGMIKEIRKELFAQPLFLVFYDRKAPRSYNSVFRNTYLVYDYVDKIKVYRNDKLFLELTP